MKGDKCIWCGDDKLDHKYYCKHCENHCKRECRTCHKPYPSLQYFENANDVRCRSCQNRYVKQKAKSSQKGGCEGARISHSLTNMSTVTSSISKRDAPNMLTDTVTATLKKRKMSMSDSDSDLDEYSDDSADDSSSDEDLLQKISKSKVSAIKQPKKKSKISADKNSPMEQTANAIDQALAGETKKKTPLLKTGQGRAQVKTKKFKKLTTTAEQKVRRSLYSAIARLQAVAPGKCTVSIDC